MTVRSGRCGCFSTLGAKIGKQLVGSWCFSSTIPNLSYNPLNDSCSVYLIFLSFSQHLYTLLPLQAVLTVFIPLFPLPATMDLTLWQYQFRIIMLGDSTVGKSSLLKRYTEDLFLEYVNQTVGVDFYVHFLEVEPGVRVKLQFWDTAGQERFR